MLAFELVAYFTLSIKPTHQPHFPGFFIFPPTQERMEVDGAQEDKGPWELGCLRIAVISSSWPFVSPSFHILSRDTLDVLVELNSLYWKNRKLNVTGGCTLPTLPSCNCSCQSHTTLPVRDSGTSGWKCQMPFCANYNMLL